MIHAVVPIDNTFRPKTLNNTKYKEEEDHFFLKKEFRKKKPKDFCRKTNKKETQYLAKN